MGSDIETSEEGFVQNYELGRLQSLFIYCRLCRNTFPVQFKPPHAEVKLRCLCKQMLPLNEFDVFQSEQAVQEHAQFYERIYRAAKDALKDAGIRMPPSARMVQINDLGDLGESELVSRTSANEDYSDIVSSYQELDESGFDRELVHDHLREFAAELPEVSDDPLRYHELLSEQIEWTFCRRYMDPAVLDHFLQACDQDMRLAKAVIKAAKQKRAAGGKAKVTFTSFKHLFVHYEEERAYEEALAVAERAAGLGLKGYLERADRIRDLLG